MNRVPGVTRARMSALARALGLACALGVVVAFALALRWTTLDIPHFFTDEPWCEGLAVSLLSGGGYTVKHVGAQVIDQRTPGLALLELGRDPREHGLVLDFYATDHQDALVDGDPSVRAPLFSALLAASVAMDGGTARVVAVNQALLGGHTARDAYDTAAHEPRTSWRRAQLALVLPSLLASLATVLLAFFAARALASPRAAIVAALAVATAPLDVWCAHRVTADTLTGATVGAVALMAARAVGQPGRRGLELAAIAGALGGLAVLSKSSGALVLPAFALAEVLILARERAGWPRWREALARVLIFGVLLAVLSLWWNGLLYLRTGELARAIGYGGIGLPPEVSAGGWPTFTRSRPFWVIPATSIWLAPLLGIGALQLVASGASLLRGASRAGSATVAAGSPAPAASRALAVHVAIAVVFLAVTLVWPSKENRFLLPAYVSLAVGAGVATDRLLALGRRAFGRRVDSRVAALMLALALGGILARSAVASRHLAPRGNWELMVLERGP